MRHFLQCLWWNLFGNILQWDCVSHRWVPWFLPKRMPLHNAIGYEGYQRRYWGNIVWIFCGIIIEPDPSRLNTQPEVSSG